MQIKFRQWIIANDSSLFPITFWGNPKFIHSEARVNDETLFWSIGLCICKSFSKSFMNQNWNFKCIIFFQSGNYICPEEMLKSETGQKGYSSLAISILSSHWWLAVTTPIRWMILSIFSLIQPFLSCGLEKHLVATAAQRQRLTKIFANLRYFETSSCGTCSSMPRFVEMFYHKRPALMAKKNIRQSLNQIRRFSAVAISPVHIRCAKALATSNLSTSF